MTQAGLHSSTARSHRRRALLAYALGTPAAAGCYWAIYMLVFGVVFAAGDAAEAPAGVWAVTVQALAILSTILGFPFMYIPDLPGGLDWSRRVFGDDNRALLGLAALNSVLWGLLTVWLIRRRLRSHAVAA